MSERLVHRRCGTEVTIPSRFVWFLLMFALGGALMFVGGLLFVFIVGIPLIALGALITIISFIAPFGMKDWRLCSKCADFWSPSDEDKELETV